MHFVHTAYDMGNIWTMNRTLKQLWQTPRLYIAILDGRVQPTLALAPDITGTNAMETGDILGMGLSRAMKKGAPGCLGLSGDHTNTTLWGL